MSSCSTAAEQTTECGCGARACGLLAVAGRAQRVVTRGCAAVARIRQQAAGSSGERTCSGEHVEREQQQLAVLLFSCGRTRCRSAPASARSAPARRRRERRLEARSTHRRPLLAPASGRGKRVMVQWIGRRREQGASCGCTSASCSPRLASFGEGEESFRLFCVDARVARPLPAAGPRVVTPASPPAAEASTPVDRRRFALESALRAAVWPAKQIISARSFLVGSCPLAPRRPWRNRPI